MKAAQPTAIRVTGFGNGEPDRVDKIFERRGQIRRHCGAEFVESPKVRIERASRHSRLGGHFFDGDAGDRLARKEQAGSLDDFSAALCSPLTADFRPPSQVHSDQFRPSLTLTTFSY